jgi:hypothetical protein
MKIIKMAQTPDISETEYQNITEAVEMLRLSTANINRSLEAMITVGQNIFGQQAMVAFKQGIINNIQSKNTANLSINNIDQFLQALTTISQSIPLINDSLKIIESNPKIAAKININTNMVMNEMITTLQSGNYAGFQGLLGQFQSALQGLTGTTQNTVPM